MLPISAWFLMIIATHTTLTAPPEHSIATTIPMATERDCKIAIAKLQPTYRKHFNVPDASFVCVKSGYPELSSLHEEKTALMQNNK